MGQLLRLALLAGLAAFGSLPAASQERPEVLRIGLLPGESAPTVIRLNQALAAHLEQVLGIEIDLIVGSDYAATGEALRFGRIDIAYLGPVTYVLQRERAQIEPFARPSHPQVGPTFQAAIIARRDSGIGTFADLAGKDVVFGDPASTSGTWVPRHQLLAAGLQAGRDYRAHFLGAHDAVALAVQNGKAAAGGISLPIYERLVKEGKIDGEALVVLELSKPIPEYAWTFREGLPADFRDEIQNAFLALEDHASLGVFRADRFVEARDGDFDIVREWVGALKRADRETQ
jgi:phosphonate transport system substrate-binding protein